MTRTIDEVDADLQQTKASVPTLEGQLTTIPVTCWESSGAAPSSLCHWAYRTPLLAADIPLSVLGLSAVFNAWSLAVSDTAYWRADLQVGTDAIGWTTVATRSTQATGAYANGAIASRQIWSLAAATGPLISVPLGQIFAITWTPTPENTSGSPADMRLPVLYTLRYAEA